MKSSQWYGGDAKADLIAGLILLLVTLLWFLVWIFGDQDQSPWAITLPLLFLAVTLNQFTQYFKDKKIQREFEREETKAEKKKQPS